MAFSVEEQQLMLATHKAHSLEPWPTQTALYNEAAAKRGLQSSLPMSMFCSTVKSIQTAQSSAPRRIWAAVEDRALREWNHESPAHTEYEVFIRRMRDRAGPSYFRPFTSVVDRVRTLGVCKASDRDAFKADGAGDGGSVARNCKRQRIGRSDSTRQIEPVVDSASCGGNGVGDMEPANVPADVQKTVEGMLRSMQKLLRESDEALFNGRPLGSPLVLYKLHNQILELTSAALSAVAGAPLPGNGGEMVAVRHPRNGVQVFAALQTKTAVPQPRVAINECDCLQSKRLVNILSEKVAAEKKYTRELTARFQQDRNDLKHQIAMLQAKLVSTTTEVINRGSALENALAEHAAQAAHITQLTRQNEQLRSELEAVRPPKESTRVPEQPVETTQDPPAPAAIVDPEPEPENRLASSQSASTVLCPPFRGLSDALLESGHVPPSARQQQLADMLAQVDDFDLC